MEEQPDHQHMTPGGTEQNGAMPENLSPEERLSDETVVGRPPLSDGTLAGEDPVAAPQQVASPERVAAPESPLGEELPAPGDPPFAPWNTLPGGAPEEIPLTDEYLAGLRVLDAVAASPIARAAARNRIERTEIPEPVSPPPAETPLMTQKELDAYLAEISGAAPSSMEKGEAVVLNQEELDALIASAPVRESPAAGLAEKFESAEHGPVPDDLSLDQSDIDRLIAEAQGAKSDPDVTNEVPVPASPSAVSADTPPSDEADAPVITQDMIDALIAEASGATSSPEGSGKPAPVHREDKGLLNQEELDQLLALAKEQEKAAREARRRAIEATLAGAGTGADPTRAAAEQDASAPPPAPRGRKKTSFRLPRIPWAGLSRFAASLVVAALAGWGASTWLQQHRERVPSVDELLAGTPASLTLAIERARPLMEKGQYAPAIRELKTAMEGAPPSPERLDAAHMLIDALFHAILAGGTEDEIRELHQLAEDTVKADPHHPAVPATLYARGRVYLLQDIPYAAHEQFAKIIEHYPDYAGREYVLAEAASVALDMGEAQLAANYAQTLLKEFPDSSRRARVRVILGDAYALAGMDDEARALYLRAADDRDPEARADALLHLGKLNLDRGRVNEAIETLRLRLATSLTTRDNDETHLLLGRALARADRLEEARKTFTDLVAFFPDSPLAPEATVELSQTLERLGKRDEAVALAMRAAARFPKSAVTLKNKAEFLGLTGSPYGAAGALMEVEALGEGDPDLLLRAARYYQAAGMSREARKVYARLRRKYSWSDQALTGAVEEARLMYADGEVREAVAQLEDLLQATRTKPQHLQTLLALADILRDLGLDKRLAETADAISREATSPETIARAAIDLVDTGELARAQEIVSALDFSRVQQRTAYRLRASLGAKLLGVDPRRGLELLETAQNTHPSLREPEMDLKLLEAYLAVDMAPQAQRVVLEFADRYQADPASTGPWLLRSALAWGDYLYQRRQFREAAEAYRLAASVKPEHTGMTPTGRTGPAWAEFQQANALAGAGDINGALALYDTIARGNGPWAADAGIKAARLRIENQVRGGGSNPPAMVAERPAP
ncbi:MAG: tetratricopeptide repeat protein [Candidatus Hydrogenedentes bacterium]|nr:tetratricopeptide repeat protein [Candidatus Hydrogenedentota bacterium]